MRKVIILILVLTALATSLLAQVTRKQADSIVREYLQNEMITYNLLYVHVNEPNEEGITITTFNEEIFTAKYACWAYYVNESEPVQRRYLFIKEDDGNLLEVIANNDLGFGNLNQWMLVETNGVAEKAKDNIKLLYPNPTNGQLTIENGELTIENVVFFDLMSRRQQITIQKQCGEITIDISHLPTGVYLVKITTEEGIITQKVIKN
jgi:hypothetical protein